MFNVKKNDNIINKYIANIYYKIIHIFMFSFIIYYINYDSDNLNKKILLKNYIKLYKQYIPKIQEEFKIKGKINLNKVIKNACLNYKNTTKINIGFTLDPGYILQTMLTITSIISTQNRDTQIIFHLGVVQDFTAEHMLKIFQLRNLNIMTEFNFYSLKEASEKMKNFHPKGEACPGKFLLPKLVPNNVERLFIFDAGDVLILRDLSKLYNYDMKDFWVIGTPEPDGIPFCRKYYNITKYLNIGSILLDVKRFKENNFWDTYTKNRNLKLMGAPDQTLFNILIPDNRKGYIPFKFGGISPFKNDRDSENLYFTDFGIRIWLQTNYSNSLPNKPKDLYEFTSQLFNPVFIHQFCYKWYSGNGLSIYRILAKYFIKLSGIWDELCSIKPGYCL